MSYDNSFHETIPLTDKQLSKAINTAKNQDAVVLAIFRYAKAPITVYQAWHLYEKGGGGMLLSSFKRSVTNLTERHADKFFKTDKTKMGPYGRPNYLYQAVTLVNQGELFQS